MLKSRLTKLEKAVSKLASGGECPMCHCIGGDGRTGHRLWIRTKDGKFRCGQEEGSVWWTPEGRCPTCGAQLTIAAMDCTMEEFRVWSR
jgi:hypothetical protein